MKDYFEGHSAHYQFVATQKLKLFLQNDIVEHYNSKILPALYPCEKEVCLIVLNVHLWCILNTKTLFLKCIADSIHVQPCTILQWINSLENR